MNLVTTEQEQQVSVVPVTVVLSTAEPSAGYLFVKRGFDIIASFLACLILLIPMLVIALLIKLDSPGPALFYQERIGKEGRAFIIYKFRTMQENAPANIPAEKFENAPYTKLGLFLRKYSLDELPQLFNILKGDMSFVGPRPLIADEVVIHELRKASGVYQLRPGLTGLAQINGRVTIDNEKKAAYDIQYLEKCSPLLDLKIMLRTVPNVFSGRDAFRFRKGDYGSENQ